MSSEYNRYDGSVDIMARNAEMRKPGSRPARVRKKRDMNTRTGNPQKADIRRERMVRFFDYNLLTVLISLICFGLVMLYSTSAYSALVSHEDSMYYFKRQIFFYIAGFVGMYIISKIDYHIYIKWALLSPGFCGGGDYDGQAAG